jgi:hypothetical protein
MALNDEAEQVAGDRDSATDNLTVGSPDTSDAPEPEVLAGGDPVADEGGAEPIVADAALDASNQADSASAAAEIGEIAASPDGSTTAASAGDSQVVEDAGLAASTPAADADDPPDTGKSIARYFPLDSDRRWEYRVAIKEAGRELRKTTATKSVKGNKEISGKQYVRVTTQSAIPAPDQYYRLDDRGVYAAVDGAPGKELLILPAEAGSVGSWSGTAEPVIPEFSGSATVGETYRGDEQVFEGCIKVSLKMTVVQRSLFGATRIPVRFDRWFAPGVGMVAEVRETGETRDPAFRSVSELTRVQP